MSAQVDLEQLPKSLIQWRRSGYDDPERGPRYIWDPLEPFFASHGYILYEAIGGKHIIWHAAVKPPRDIPLVVDKSVCKTTVSFEGDKFFSMVRTCLCPARTTAGKDVILRIIAKGSAGHDHLQVIRTLKSLPHRCNHAIPLLAELSIGDMTFGVFPTLGDSPDTPWFHTYEEAFDFIDQLFEGLSFMHSHLIAHLDISLDNILVNCIGPRKTSFQSRFKVFYYYNDFELAVYFTEDTNPAEMVVSGLPTQRFRVLIVLSKPMCGNLVICFCLCLNTCRRLHTKGLSGYSKVCHRPSPRCARLPLRHSVNSDRKFRTRRLIELYPISKGSVYTGRAGRTCNVFFVPKRDVIIDIDIGSEEFDRKGCRPSPASLSLRRSHTSKIKKGGTENHPDFVTDHNALGCLRSESIDVRNLA